MILFLADGRLGNQVFQYAFLKTIAKNNERIFCLNMSQLFNTFEFDTKNIFKINNRCIVLFVKLVLVPYFIRPLSKLRLVGYIEQQKDVYRKPLPSYFSKKGFFPFWFVNIDFFQSETFFDNEFFSDARIKDQYLLEACKFLAEIPSEHYKVFVHIRRGDYLDLVFMGDRGIELPKQYFERSMEIMQQNINNPFFVFLSDDPKYVELVFHNVMPKVISRNSVETDLAIMSLCNAGIISNSSFSWWGSALMKDRSIVIAPKYWYGWKQKIESHPGIQPSWALIIDVDDTSN